MDTGSSDFSRLIQKLQSGDQEAFTQLMPMLRPIVRGAVNHFVGAGRAAAPREDFMQEAWVAVYRALFNYDTERYPVLVRSYFRRAVISRLDSVNNATYMVGLPRPLKRFLRDAAIGNIDWTYSDTELQSIYPMVAISDIAKVRVRGTQVFDVALACDDYVHPSIHPGGGMRDVEDEVINRLETAAMCRALASSLTSFEYRVFVLRFVEDRTRTEAARELGCSVSGVAETEKAIIRKRAGIEDVLGSLERAAEEVAEADRRSHPVLEAGSQVPLGAD